MLQLVALPPIGQKSINAGLKMSTRILVLVDLVTHVVTGCNSKFVLLIKRPTVQFEMTHSSTNRGNKHTVSGCQKRNRLQQKLCICIERALKNCGLCLILLMKKAINSVT